MNDQESTIQMPSTILLLGSLLVIATLASIILPAGSFERVEKEIAGTSSSYESYTIKEGDTVESIREEFSFRFSTQKPILNATGDQVITLTQLPESGTEIQLPLYSVSTRDVIVQDSFNYKEDDPEAKGNAFVTFFVRLFTAPIKGFEDKANIIAFVLLIGGAFGIIMASGAIDWGLTALVKVLGDSKFDWVVIPICMFAFSFGGATFGLSEEVIPFVMLTIPLALKLGYDIITGINMSFVGAGLGFAAAFQNPFTIGIAQGIAGLEPFSGSGFRIIIWFIITSIGAAYALNHARRVKKDPTLSPAYDFQKSFDHKEDEADANHKQKSHLQHIGVIAIIFITVGIIYWGVDRYAWWMTEISAVFVGAGFFAAIVGGMKPSKAANAFMKGVTDLASVAVIIAFSGGIVIVLQEGEVLDTILNFLASPFSDLAPTVAAGLMFIFQTVLIFFVPSGSGQAAMTMPIMAPLSDLLGVSRQTAVLAYQFGDGFGNMIIPTSAVTMSVLSVAKLPWKVWAKWLLPLEVILAICGFIILGVAVSTGF